MSQLHRERPQQDQNTHEQLAMQTVAAAVAARQLRTAAAAAAASCAAWLLLSLLGLDLLTLLESIHLRSQDQAVAGLELEVL